MKNYILTLLFALVALTSCNNDEYYYYKTPGEITGEKIMEMVVANNYQQQCVIPGVNNQPRSFYIEGQFLHLNGENGSRKVSFDLNQLLRWEYIAFTYPDVNKSYFHFTFNTK